MGRRIPILFAIVLSCGCSTIHRTELPSVSADTPQDGAPLDLSQFWMSNGFKRVDGGHGGCELLYPAQRRDVEQRTVACWERWYPGWIFPYSGGLFGIEVWEGGKYVVYVYSNGRETEAADVAENLRLFLGTQHPDVTVVGTAKWFVDLR